MIKVSFQGVEEFKRLVAEYRRRGSNLKPLLVDISEIIHSEVDENFQAGGRDPRWKESERARKHGGQTLIDKGQLLSSIERFVMANSAGVDTNKKYAAIHNFGGPITRKPHSGTVRLRTDSKGNLLRQGTEGLKANLAVFAKAKHKLAVSKSFSSAGYTWNMPQREFMKVSPAGINKIEIAAAGFLTTR